MVDTKGIAASGGTLTVVSGNSLVQLEGVPGRVTVNFDIEVNHPSGKVITMSLPDGVDSLGIEVDPENLKLLLVKHVNSDGSSYEVVTTRMGSGHRNVHLRASLLRVLLPTWRLWTLRVKNFPAR